MDICMAAPAYLVSSPIIVAAGLAAKLETRGPAIFKQTRIAHGGKEFTCYKIRTMANEKVTKVGSFLRKYSLDELPQFLNILKGDMALIGPRAITADDIIKKINQAQSSNFLKRLCVKPGFGFGHNEKNWAIERKIQTEHSYINSLYSGNLKPDFKIFISIVKSVLLGKNQ